MDYIERFKEALLKTSEIFGQSENVEFNVGNKYIDEAKLGAFFQGAYNKLRAQGIKLAGNCTTVHWNAVEELGRELGCKAYFTVGYVVDAGQEHFRFSYDDLKRWKKTGLSGQKLKLHAWLTLDSMEIVDFTYGSTIAEVFPNLRQYDKTLVALAPDEQEQNFHYVPLIVKDDILHQLQAY